MVSEMRRFRGIRHGGVSRAGEGGSAVAGKLRTMLRAFAFILLSGCSMNSAFAKKVPYALKAQMVTEPSAIYDIAGLDFCFLNREEQKVTALTLVFFLYDEDGNMPSLGPNNVELEIYVEVEPGQLVEDCVCIDSFLYEIPEEPYQLDYLYVSRIVYEDGSEWSDPFGLYCVN